MQLQSSRALGANGRRGSQQAEALPISNKPIGRAAESYCGKGGDPRPRGTRPRPERARVPRHRGVGSPRTGGVYAAGRASGGRRRVGGSAQVGEREALPIPGGSLVK